MSPLPSSNQAVVIVRLNYLKEEAWQSLWMILYYCSVHMSVARRTTDDVENIVSR